MTGDQLRAHRARLGMTQREFAGELGVSVTTIVKWERGERRISPLADLAVLAVRRKPGRPKKRPALGLKGEG